MKKSYYDIKTEAKNRLHSRFGDALLITLVPTFIVLVLTFILGKFLVSLPVVSQFYISNGFSLLFSVFSGYIAIKLMLLYLRGKNGVSFEGFFDFDKNVIWYGIYTLLVNLIMLSPFIKLFPYYLELLNNPVLANDPVALEAYLNTTNFYADSMSTIITMIIVYVVFAFLIVRLQFAAYLIIDKNATLIEGLKKSWKITKGNFFRILFFPLSFIGWFFLAMISCGLAIFYLAPYYAVAKANLFFSLMEENGDEEYGDFTFNNKPSETEEIEKEQDPLDQYYV